MIGRLTKYIVLSVSILSLFIYGVAYAGSPTNVSIIVQDKSGDILPFATVTVDGDVLQTGSKGEPVIYSLTKGSYDISASHLLVRSPKGAIITARARLKLKNNRQSVNLSIRLKQNSSNDSTPPTLELVAPAKDEKIKLNTPLKITANSIDPESEIAKISATLDNREDLGNPSKEGNSYSWNKTQLTEGNHTVNLTSWNYGGKTTTNSVAFEVVPSYGNLVGNVRFLAGPINGASIKVEGTELIALSDDLGNFAFNQIKTGQYKIIVSANGFAEQSQMIKIEENQSARLDFTLVDNQAPAVPANLEVKSVSPSATSQVISWNKVTDLSGVKYELSQFKDETLIKTHKTVESSLTLNQLTPGSTYKYAIRALDNSSNENASAWSNLVSGTTQKLPTVSWITPTKDATIRGQQTLSVNFAVFGTNNKVSKIDWQIENGSMIGTTNPTTQTGASSADLDTFSLENGTYILQAIITDLEGNSNQAGITITVNNPIAGKIIGQVTYEGRPVIGAKVKSDEQIIAITNNTGNYVLKTTTLGTRTLLITATGLSDQTKVVNIASGDPVTINIAMIDQIAPTTPTDVKVINTKPTISQQTVSWGASSDFSGIKQYTVSRFVGVELAESKTVVDALTVNFTGLENDKEYGYTVSATDNATSANVSSASAVVRTKTQFSPAIVWNTPVPNQAITGNFQLRVTAYGFGGGKIEWFNVTDSNIIGNTTVPDDSSSSTLDWDTTLVNNGSKVLKVRFTDSEENVATAEVNASINNIFYGNITGKITDVESVVPNVEVTLKKADGTVAGNATTNASGNFEFKNVVTGNYSLSLAAEGYVDKTVNKSVAVGENTLNESMTLLPRINGFTGTGRTLAIPGLASKWPRGLSINPLNGELLSIEKNNVNIYDPKTEKLKKVYENAGGGGNDFYIATDHLGFMTANDRGWSHWFNITTLISTQGWAHEWKGMQSTKDGSIVAADANKIWRIIDRKKVPENGYDVRHITTYNASGLGISDKSAFIANHIAGSNNKIFRLNLANPSDQAKSIYQTIPYPVSTVHYVEGTRTLLVTEALTRKLHLLDARNLEEYSMIENLIPAPFGETNNLATVFEGSKVKLFISSAADEAIYINLSD